MKLLYAEDEMAMSEAVTEVLKRRNYIVDSVYDGEEALDYIDAGIQYDGIILDVMMPKRSGIEVLKEIRRRGMSTPVLLLTAKSEVADKVEGLNAGADDYLAKPFAMPEFVARVAALVRRRGEMIPDDLTAGNVTLNRSTFELSTSKGEIRLSKKEYLMMEMLMKSHEHPVSTESFMDRIWGYDSEAEVNVVWVYISYLRKKLAALGANIQISALRGRGYVLEEIRNA
ncbi:MAG: response regulator transcription factor [Clostridia bacterium]|nr:response regulator transcription factor [Clostridia bacterium]